MPVENSRAGNEKHAISGAGNDKQAIRAGDIALLLLDEITGRDAGDSSREVCRDEATTARFEAKARLYQLAAVLSVLRNEQTSNPRYSSVREQLEKIVASSWLKRAPGLLEQVNTA